MSDVLCGKPNTKKRPCRLKRLPADVRLRPVPGTASRRPARLCSQHVALCYTRLMPDETTGTPSLTIHPRLEPTIRVRLDAYCQRERRSITNAVNKLLDDALTAVEADTEAKS